ncbi:lysoplasmalogenase family protein [Propionibacteriaceae bacterium Y2011]
MRRIVAVLAAVVFVVSSVLHLAAQVTGDPFWINVTIFVPVFALLVCFVAAVRRWDTTARFTVLGLGFSWLGDGVGSISLTVKIGFFLVAQLCYIVAFLPLWRQIPRRRLRIAAYAVVVVVVVAMLLPMAGSLAPAVVAYGVALGLMALLAGGLGPIAAVGGGLFLVSDTLLGVQQFSPVRLPMHGLLIMVTYLVAQVLLASQVMRTRLRA